ncbi:MULTISPECIES: hypothetical protein [unclassified Pseudomonas]|uniref:hypothetical protein n=1 Tax=unclassified Pseudomonas TaxID=196821 RepID=UPI000A1FFBC2|nr:MULTISPECIES: hypothetical protein [unclassified Pseudomonas]
MRRRGAQYWLWVDKRMPGKTHEDFLSDGRQIEVQARLTSQRMTQVFVGIYTAEGAAVCEAFQERLAGDTLSSAIEWGVQCARQIIVASEVFKAPHLPQFTLSPVILDDTKMALRRMEMCELERLKLQSQDAWEEYLAAKEAMLDLMRRPTVADNVWAEHKDRLQQAIDRRASIPRTYLR